MTMTTISPPARVTQRVALAVDVVDGMGQEVPGQQVVADFSGSDGTTESMTAVTDSAGRAEFLHQSDAHVVIVRSGTESNEVLSPRHGAVLVLEM